MGMTTVGYLLQLLTALPQLIQAGADVIGVVNETKAKAEQFVTEKRDPTPEEWDALNARILALRNELHKK